MKKLNIVLILMCVVMGNAFAQNYKGTFGALKGEKRAAVEVCFDRATIYGMDEQAFADYETDWNEDKPEIIARFIEGAQEELCHKLTLVNGQVATDYTLRIEVLNFNADGTCLCDVALLDKDKNEVGRIENIAGEGKGGTKLRRIKNSAEDAGAYMGKYLKKAIRKC